MDGITTSINSILKNLIKNFNTLLDCPVRYNGEYNGQKVHNFIEYIESYKRIKCITDEQALQELQFLLIDQAHAWWLRRITHFETWSEALTFLENHYSKQRPSHIIYKEVFKPNFDDYDIKEDFIDDKNELLDELTQPKLSEKTKLEIIYALLPNDLQTKIQFVNIINLKDLKKQLQKFNIAKEAVNLTETQNSIVPTHETEVNILSKTVNSNDKSNEDQQDHHMDTADNNTNLETNKTYERDPIIKVRRTEDLMPHVKDEEEQNIAQQNEFIANDAESTKNNNTSHNSNEHFQIDSDIMNQINNIIDESEMNALHHNQHIPTQISGPPNSSSAIACLLQNIQSELSAQKLSETSRKSTQATKKGKLRCSYCRRFNHTSQTCIKKAKQIKQFPEKFMISKTNKTSSSSQISVTEAVVEPLSSNNNIDATSTASIETSINTSSVLNTLMPNTSTITSVPTVSSIFSIIPDKCINPSLTTKLIAPINGPVPNKIMAAKLRNSNGHMPKCHQCGTVGFYKSICPNCSPIYNNNNQYK